MGKCLAALTGIRKAYGSKIIFRGIDIKLEGGKIALILGANGAGKSTLLKIAAGLSQPDAGDVARNYQGAAGYLGHATFLYPGLTALENLAFHGAIAGRAPKESALLECLEKVELKRHAREQTRFFSRGMAQRLNFARLLLVQPRLALLDEPFTGLDQRSRSLMRREIIALRAAGSAIAMVSHDVENDSGMADYVFVLDKGIITFAGSPGDYLRQKGI